MQYVFFLGLFLVTSVFATDKIKLYTFCTPSHEILRDQWFLPSIKDNFELIVENHDQQCSTGVFKEEGWNDTMINKVVMLIRAVKDNWNKIFVYADIQFFKPIEPVILGLMDDHDLLVQRDNPSGEICAGFLVCRGNEKTLDLFSRIKKMMLEEKKRDQESLNYLLLKDNKLKVIWDYLPAVFFGAGTLTGVRWLPNDTLDIPKGILLHHANFTTGVSNKIAQLKYVREQVFANHL